MVKTFLNTLAAKEYAADIDRCICAVKDRRRSMTSDLPLNFLHKLVVVNLVYVYILWVNAFPTKNSISQEISPRSIMVCNKLSWKQHFHIKFGDYTKVRDEPDPSNTLTPHTHTEISVSNTGNFNGTDNCFWWSAKSWSVGNLPAFRCLIVISTE